MPTRIAFAGPHAIGKTTSAINLNKRLPDHLYVPSFASAVATKMGFDLNKPFTDEQLLTYQERLLEVFIESFKATDDMDTIYDRSPLDFAAYVSVNITADTDRSRKYVNACIAATQGYCTYVIYPQADLSMAYESKDKRPAFNEQEVVKRKVFAAYIDRFCDVVMDKVKVIDVPIRCQYEERINYIMEFVK